MELYVKAKIAINPYQRQLLQLPVNTPAQQELEFTLLRTERTLPENIPLDVFRQHLINYINYSHKKSKNLEITGLIYSHDFHVMIHIIKEQTFLENLSKIILENTKESSIYADHSMGFEILELFLNYPAEIERIYIAKAGQDLQEYILETENDSYTWTFIPFNQIIKIPIRELIMYTFTGNIHNENLHEKTLLWFAHEE